MDRGSTDLTSEAEPSLPDMTVPENILAILKLPVGERAEEQKKELASASRTRERTVNEEQREAGDMP